MTTIIDPFGTPQPVFNKGGVALFDLAAVLGSTVSIPSGPGHIIAVCTVSGTSGTALVELPTNADIGDCVEVYVRNDSVSIVAPSGDGLLAAASPIVTRNEGAFFRKVSSTDWACKL